jgi:hypothetical protein
LEPAPSVEPGVAGVEFELVNLCFVWTTVTTTTSFTADADIIIRLASTSGSAFYCGITNMSHATAIATPGIRRDVILLSAGSNNSFAQHVLNYKVFNGQTIYVSNPATAGTLNLFFTYQ